MKKIITAFILLVACFFLSVSKGAGEGSSGYAGSGECKTCHEDIYNSWKNSKHALTFQSGQENSQACGVCHKTAAGISSKTEMENYIGCEACHGPGKNHIKSEGNAAEIVSSISADICGRCHSGSKSDYHKELLSQYTPGMALSNIKGLKLITVSPDKTVPYFEDIHPSLTYNMWLASGHAKPPARDFEINGEKWEGPITCSVCHNPHYSDNPSQLVMKPEDLCKSCHFQGAVLKGFGAKGIEETRSLHTAAPCVSCHMTEKNHLMKMLRPDDPDLAENRLDSCSACHEVKDREMRSHQLRDMEAWYNETMEPVQKDLKFVEEKLKENPGILDGELKGKFEDTKNNLSIIIDDGSNGVHNLDYALEIMYLAKKHLKEIKKAIE